MPMPTPITSSVPVLSDDEYIQKLKDLQTASDAKVAALKAMPKPVGTQIDLGMAGSILGDIGVKLAQGTVDLGQSVVGLGSLATGGLIGDAMHGIGYDPQATNQFLGQYLSKDQQAADDTVQQAQGFKNTLVASLQNPRSILGSVAESLPGMMGGMGVTSALAERIALKAALETAAGKTALAAGKTADEAGRIAMGTVAGQVAAKGAVDAAETSLLVTGAATEGAQTTGQIADQAQGQGRDYGDYALPAIAAGIGTGALNLMAGKIMGSATTDLAAGTHTLKGNFATKLAKEGFSEGVLEELPQSAQEQVWTNIATGKDWDEGVGQAAAQGLVAGAAMGAGFGGLHGLHNEADVQAKADKIVQTVQKAQAFSTAVKTGDLTTFLDEGGKHYDPVLAVRALAQQNLSGADFDTQVENYNKATDIMDKISERVDQLNKTLKTGTQDEKVAAKAALNQLKSVNTDGQAVWSKMLDELQKSMDSQTVQEKVDAANAPVDANDAVSKAASDQAAQSVINLSMASPRAITPEQASTLAENKENGLNDEQRSFLRTFSEARQAFNAAQDINSVQKQVLYGDQGQMGINQFRERIGAAIQTGNQAMAQKYLGMLDAFASAHTEKALAADIANTKGGQLYKTDKGWGYAPAGTYDASTLRANGQYPIVKPKLVTAIKAEAKALAATRDEMKQAVLLKFAGQDQGAPVQSTPSPAAPQSAAAPSGSPASLFREMREREGRVEGGEPPSPQNPVSGPSGLEGNPAAPVAAKPQSAWDKAQARNAKQQAIVDAAIAKDAARRAAKNVSTESPASPASDTSRPIAADAAQAAVPSLASAAKYDLDGFHPLGEALRQAEIASSKVDAWNSDTEEAKALVKTETDAFNALHAETSRLIDRLASFNKEQADKFREELKAEDGTALEAGYEDHGDYLRYLYEDVLAYAREVHARQGDLLSTPKQAAAEQPASTSEASVAPAAEAAPAKQSSPIEALNEKGAVVEGDTKATYLKKRLGDFFRQAGAGLNPLASVKDFISSIGSVADFKPYLNGDIEGRQLALNTFLRVAKAWAPRITKNLDPSQNADYSYRDAMRYFVRSNGDVEENVKTAIIYAAFSYIAENFGASGINSNDQINSLLGRQKESGIHPDAAKELRNVLAGMPSVIESLGKRAVAALGLEALKDTPVNELSRLQAGLGAHALRLLTDETKMPDVKNEDGSVTKGKTIPALIQIKNIHKDKLEAWRKGDYSLDTEGIADSYKPEDNERFVVVNRQEDGSLLSVSDYIVQANRDSRSAVNALFKVEGPAKPPTFEPVKSRTNAKRTDQEVPSFLMKILNKLNQQKNFLRADKFEILSRLGDERFLSMMGVIDDQHIEQNVSAGRRDALKATNDGLIRELDNIKEFYHAYLNGDTSTPFYFEHYAMKQQRVGIANGLVNPQLSKIHRFMVSRNSWISEVDLSNHDSMQNFMLRVAEGMGVSTDKADRATALDKITAKLADPVVQAGVAALRKITTGEHLSDEEQDAIVAAVAKGGEKAHSLDALVAIAVHEDAKAEQKTNPSKTTFKVNMLAEVDGVTNGPMLSHLLMGAAESGTQLLQMLRRGGFFTELGAQFNDWRSTAGNQDLYETTSNNVLDRLDYLRAKKFDEDQKTVINHVLTFMGQLKDDKTGKITSAGRSMIKTPLTALVYGSGMGAAIEGMAADFVQNIYKRIEQAAELSSSSKAEDRALGNKMHAENVAALKGLGIGFGNEPSIADMLDTKFSPKIVHQLVSQFKDTMGRAVKLTIKDDFKHLMANRKDFNQTASLAFTLYDTAYKSLRQQLVDELVAKGEIPVIRGSVITDLNPAQEEELDKRMSAITPTLQTAMSNLSGPAHAHSGMLMADSEMQPGKTSAYKNVVQFGTKFLKKADSLEVHGRELVNSNPGVSLGATSTHSFDSAVSHSAIRGREILNLHDAHGTSITDLVHAGTRLNQAVWDRAIQYSPAQEAYDGFMRTVGGIHALLNDKTLPEGLAQALAKGIFEEAIKGEQFEEFNNPLTYLQDRAVAAKILAFRTDSVKLEAMSQMQSIAQYAVEGGNFTVEDSHRAEAQAKLDELDPAMPEEDRTLVMAVQDQLKPLIDKLVAERHATEVQARDIKQIGGLGKPAVQSDAKLIKFLNGNPSTTASSLIGFLKTQTLTPFQKTLLASLERALGPRAANTAVQFVEASTTGQQMLDVPGKPSHAWFVSRDGKSQINFLSPAFKESGLTLETALHELTHAAVAHAIAAPDEHTRPLVAELENLRQIAETLIRQNNMTTLLPAVENVQELVAWGMTNPALQQLLDSHLMQTQNGSNKWVSGFKKFIDTLVQLVTGKANPNLSTGLSVLITNVTGLMAKSASGLDFKGYINQSMTAPLAALKGEDMFNALGQIGHSTMSAGFQDKLRSTIRAMDESVHSPLAAMKQSVQATAVQTPYAMWVMAKRKGAAPFARSALASGFRFSEQEAFALEQVQATVYAALNNPDGSTTALYRELAKLYNEAQANLKSRINDFHPDPVQAKALYDFIFKMAPGLGDKSDYLSRFAALGLANEQFNKLLDFNTAVKQPGTQALSFIDKLHALFDKFMAWVNTRATSTFEGQKADSKLQALVEQLVDVEQRKRMKLSQSASVMTDTIEQLFNNAATSGKQVITNIANSSFFKNSTNGVMRFTGSMTSVIASNRLNGYLDAMQTFRDKFIGERNGTLMGLVNEARGAHDGNAQMHALLRISKRIEAMRKDLITNTASFVTDSFVDKGKHLDDAAHNAISAVLLRGDVQTLLNHGFTMQDIQHVLLDKTTRDGAIARFENELNQFGNLATPYRNGAENLGFFMATGRAGAANLMLNPENIANRLGTQFANKVQADIVTQATPVIDALSTLYAVKHMAEGQATKDHFNALSKVFRQEMGRTDGGNGLEFTLRMHGQLQQESKERLFDGKGALRMKGYTPEIYNPYIRLQVADYITPDADGKTAGDRLVERGYAPGATVLSDRADPDLNEKRIYSLRDGGLVQHLTGIFSYTGQRRRGTAVHNGNLNVKDDQGLMNVKQMQYIRNKQLANVNEQQTKRIDPKKGSVDNNFLVPVFNADGKLVNFRYMMNVQTKDTLLERDNRFDNMLGVMAGNIFDKEKTAEQNRMAVQALYDQYKADYNTHPESYMEVGPNSMDPEARETWRLLPEVTKQAVKDVWGTDSMKVRIDQMDINFGYRKLSLAEPFGIPEDQRSNFEDAYVKLMESVMGKKAGLYLRRGEDIWQTLVREAKDTMVVKSGTTLLGNFTSNVSELIWFGVPMADIWRHHQTALKGVTAYRKDSREMEGLQTALKLGVLNGRDKGEMERRVVQLKDSLARNPVRELVDAGLMPTIVEDVAADEDRYSYKGQLTRKVDEVVGNLNPVLLKAGKLAVMAHDTPIYKALSYATQVSDFLARYTLYQHTLEQKKNPMTKDQAIQLVSDAFVNYDVPSHRNVQYANDMGLVYFSKYYLRIQKVIALLYKQNPGRAMMLLTAGHFLDFIPMLQHSAFIHRIGNPFSTGAFEAVSSLKDMMTVKTLMTPFK